MSLVNPLEPSSCAATFEGPNVLIPAVSRSSTTPAQSGPSGPTTTKSTLWARQKAITALWSVMSRSAISASCAMPALPGAQKSRSTSGLAAIFQASACSRPPEPRRRMFICLLAGEGDAVPIGLAWREGIAREPQPSRGAAGRCRDLRVSEAMATIDERRAQMFPKLSRAEIERIRRFGKVRRYRAGEALTRTGEPGPGMFVFLSGSISVIGRDPLGHQIPIVEEGPGEFLAEVGQLSGGPAFVDVHAVTDVEALLVPPEGLRSLLIAEAQLGEKIMRALI